MTWVKLGRKYVYSIRLQPLSHLYLPKLIKVGGNLTKFWQKQKCTVFLRRGVELETRWQLRQFVDHKWLYRRIYGLRSLVLQQYQRDSNTRTPTPASKPNSMQFIRKLSCRREAARRLCLSVVSFNSQSNALSVFYYWLLRLHIYQGVQINFLLFSSAWPSTYVNKVDACCDQHTQRLTFVDNTRHSTMSKRDIGRKSYPICIWFPVRGVHVEILPQGLVRKKESCGYPTVKKIWECLPVWDSTRTWQAPDEQTDGHCMDRHRKTAKAARAAWLILL